RDFGLQAWPLPTYFLILMGFLPASLLSVAFLLAWPRLWPVVTDRGKLTRLLVALNLTTLFNWMTFLESLKLANAALCASIVVGGMPLWMLLIERLLNGRIIKLRDCLAALLVVAGVGLLAWDELGKDPVSGALGVLVTGIALAFTSSFF